MSPIVRRLVRSYGLLVVLALVLLVMAMFVREKDKTVPVESIGVVDVAGVLT